MDWIISDTHFDHENIIKYCSRPYKNANQMTEDLVRRWNNRVKPGDLVYHLGDVGYMKGAQEVKTEDTRMGRIIARLNGKKILILGNHDKSAKRMMEFGFDFACEAMVVRPDGVQRTVYMHHKPMSYLPVCGMEPGEGIDYVLHGHIHNSTPESRQEHVSKGELVHIPKFNINMSVEMWNYEPVPLAWVVKKKIYEDKHQ